MLVSLTLTNGGILSSGITEQCAYPECSSRFEPYTANQRYCNNHRVKRGQAQSNIRKARTLRHDLTFIGVDGEGSGHGRDHRYVLLGCGEQYVTWDEGVRDITDVFGFLYGQFEKTPGAVFAGFFLGYDYNMWLRLLPRERAWMLLTDEGRARRKRRGDGHHLPPWPVEYRGWEFDMLAYKRLKVRPKGGKWLYVNDTGPFFQTSFLKVIDPRKWPDEGIVTDAEYAKLKTGKDRRADAVLDDDMIAYNMLENDVLARVLERLNEGFSLAGVRLDKRQWFGPGQAAQKWIGIDKKLDVATIAVHESYPEPLHDALVASYYGGWFEITAHGIVPGRTYEYDVNSAYPYTIARLPCACGPWSHGKGTPRSGSVLLRLCRVSVRGGDSVLGPLPYRTRDGRVLRPLETSGWYWEDEINAARKAGLIEEVIYHEWWAYKGCGHKPPLRGLAGLYDARLRVGKDTPQGKAYKLVYNAVYGKLAQSVGSPRYGNAFYASRITGGCRTQILEAVASHPEQSGAVVMVATDAVYFTSPHPGLTVSDKLGDWSGEVHENLTLFKPGVYWNDETRRCIANNEDVAFKARGISARDFAKSLSSVDSAFESWNNKIGDKARYWPEVSFQSGFAQISITQALRWTEYKPEAYRHMAGLVMENRTLVQSADPVVKRDSKSLYRDEAGVWRTRPWRHRAWPESTPYDRRFGWDEPEADFAQYATPDGSVLQGFRDVLGVG